MTEENTEALETTPDLSEGIRKAAEEAAATAAAEQAKAEAEATARAAEMAEGAEAAAMAALQAEAEADNGDWDTTAATIAAFAAADAAAPPSPSLYQPDIVEAPKGHFGETFTRELAAIGLDTAPIVYGESTVVFDASIKPEDRAKIMEVIEAHDPAAEPANIPDVIVVDAVTFYRRLKADEGPKVEGAVAAQPFIQRRIFESANTFRSDAPEWPDLVALAEGLFGKDRAAELLAPT